MLFDNFLDYIEVCILFYSVLNVDEIKIVFVSQIFLDAQKVPC